MLPYLISPLESPSLWSTQVQAESPLRIHLSKCPIDHILLTLALDSTRKNTISRFYTTDGPPSWTTGCATRLSCVVAVYISRNWLDQPDKIRSLCLHERHHWADGSFSESFMIRPNFYIILSILYVFASPCHQWHSPYSVPWHHGCLLEYVTQWLDKIRSSMGCFQDGSWFAPRKWVLYG